ncbi:hypothetical protein [Sphingomonas profundi]|nr:hypothetical protein [Sphingomonas profundi]
MTAMLVAGDDLIGAGGWPRVPYGAASPLARGELKSVGTVVPAGDA